MPTSNALVDAAGTGDGAPAGVSVGGPVGVLVGVFVGDAEPQTGAPEMQSVAVPRSQQIAT